MRSWRCAHVVARHNAAYFTHLRDESDRVLEAIDGGDRDRPRLSAMHVEIVH